MGACEEGNRTHSADPVWLVHVVPSAFAGAFPFWGSPHVFMMILATKIGETFNLLYPLSYVPSVGRHGGIRTRDLGIKIPVVPPAFARMFLSLIWAIGPLSGQG